jgi:hypothetical protein
MTTALARKAPPVLMGSGLAPAARPGMTATWLNGKPPRPAYSAAALAASACMRFFSTMRTEKTEAS